MTTGPLTATESEAIAVAAVLNGAETYKALRPEDFHDSRNADAYAAIQELVVEGVSPGAAAVSERLKERAKPGVATHVLELAERYEMAIYDSPSYHADIVRDRAIRRRLANAGLVVARQAERLDLSLTELLDQAERRVFQVADSGDSASATLLKSRLMNVVGLIESGGYKGKPTGFVDLDHALTGGGFLPGQLVVVAGATSMGKSAFTMGLTNNMAIHSKEPVAYFSIEMTKDDNTLRMLAMEALADLKAMCGGTLPDEDMPKITHAASLLNDAPIYLHDSATTVAEIRSEARRLKAQSGLTMAVVDHVQDMEHPAEARREQLGAIARGLKALAKELDITVVAVSQLSRAVESRPEARPRIGDLKESGDIENSADVVLLLYRPGYYKGADAHQGEAELIVGKQRNGPTPSIPLFWRAECARYESADPYNKVRIA